MANFNSKDKKAGADYGAEVRHLKQNGPEGLYLLCGEEDYLRELYFEELKKICLEGGEQEFNHKRIDGPGIDMAELEEAVNAVPFFAERTLVELRNWDINKCRDNDAQRLKEILSDIPGYCTIVVIIGANYETDGRLAAIKTVKKLGKTLEFKSQDQSRIADWIGKRFAALGKNISRRDAEYLMFISGTLMNRLIPEIEKIASYSAEDTISREDIDKTAHRIPEADVFTMTELLGKGNVDRASAVLADLLHDNQHPIMLLALIAQQLRRLYAAKLCQQQGKSRTELMEILGVKYSFIAEKAVDAAKNYSLNKLQMLLELGAEYDYKLKSSGGDPEGLIKEFVMLMAGE